MALTFNTTGPCIPGEHYMLSPGKRFGRVVELVEQKKYFTLHAGRQTGKTTSIQWLTQRINAGEQYSALWVDVQTAREEPDIGKAMREVLYQIEHARKSYLPNLPTVPIEQLLKTPRSALRDALSLLSSGSKRPLVLFIDESDGLVGDAMVSFLTQLRQGYIDRSLTPFPQSVALVGMRQVRDYALSLEEHRHVAWLGTTSPFNITAEATTLRHFLREEVEELLLQHTQATGQRFLADAIESIWDLSRGHPWLVNALAAQIVHVDVRDVNVAVTAAHVESAKETIIVERRTHIDSLIARLREPRVLRIIAPMLAGERTNQDVLDDDFDYVKGLGLLTERDGRYEIANPIYREVIPRALTHVQQMQIQPPVGPWLREDGRLDVEKLLRAWQAFWRKDGHLAAEGFGYREAGPHLMLMAFLQRIINGGGRIEREYGLGRGVLDLLVEWNNERHAIEVKLRRDTETEAEALEQIARYLEVAGLKEGWLVTFDLRKERTWAEKLTMKPAEIEGKRIWVVGC